MNVSDVKLAAVVLAAGQSKRFGKANKLLHEVDGVSLLRTAVSAVGSVDLADFVVVVGHEADSVIDHLRGESVRCVLNSEYENGMGGSLSLGVAALDCEELDGVIVCLADLPQIRASHVRSLVERFVALGAQRVVLPVFEGMRGHPVCFPKRMLAGLKTLSGDRGARDMIRADRMEPCLVEMKDDACIQDMDES